MSGEGYGLRMAGLCLDATSGSLQFSEHYALQSSTRPTPTREDVRFLLCEDDAEVIEDYPYDNRGPCCLIRGTTNHEGRVGHLVCAIPPGAKIITAYFPGETAPHQWDDNYRRRIQGGPP